jgi:hypothetical protein
VGSRICLDEVKKKIEFLTLSELELRPLCCPAPGQSVTFTSNVTEFAVEDYRTINMLLEQILIENISLSLRNGILEAELKRNNMAPLLLYHLEKNKVLISSSFQLRLYIAF